MRLQDPWNLPNILEDPYFPGDSNPNEDVVWSWLDIINLCVFAAYTIYWRDQEAAARTKITLQVL